MPKKPSKQTNAKPKNILVEIKQAHACIEADSKRLEKLYTRALVDTQKQIKVAKKAIAKAKKQAAMVKRDRRSTPKATHIALSELLKQQQSLEVLQGQDAELSKGAMKFFATQKAYEKIEKTWDKQSKTKRKKKRVMRQGRATTTLAQNASLNPTNPNDV